MADVPGWWSSMQPAKPSRNALPVAGSVQGRRDLHWTLAASKAFKEFALPVGHSYRNDRLREAEWGSRASALDLDLSR